MKKVRRKHLVAQAKPSSQEENDWKDKVKEYTNKRDAFLDEEKKKWKKRNTVLRQQQHLPETTPNVPYTGKHISDTLFRLRAYSVKVYSEIQRREEEFQRMKQHYKYCAALPPEVESDMSFCYAKLPAYVLTIKQLKSMKISGRKMAIQAGKAFTFDDDIDCQADKFEFLLTAVKNFILEINSFFSVGNVSSQELSDEIEAFINSCVIDRNDQIIRDVNIQRRTSSQNTSCSSTNPVLSGAICKPNHVQNDTCGKPAMCDRPTTDKAVSGKCNEIKNPMKNKSEKSDTAHADELENQTLSELPDIRNPHIIPECTICRICFTKRKNFLRHMVSMHNYKC